MRTPNSSQQLYHRQVYLASHFNPSPYYDKNYHIENDGLSPPSESSLFMPRASKKEKYGHIYVKGQNQPNSLSLFLSLFWNQNIRMWDTFYGHSAYIQITFVTCQEEYMFYF